MKKIILTVVISLCIVLAVLVGLYRLMNATTYQIVGRIVNQVDTDQKVVALTFDDGPNQHTDTLLEILEEKKVPATFYLVGDQIEDNLDEAQKIAAAGHQLGNHSYSHSRMIFKSPQFIISEIESTSDLIRQAGYEGQITFRPPYGKKLVILPLYLEKNDITTVMWSLDPLQTLPPTASSEEITKFVIQHTTPGSIILIHPWYGEQNSSREAVPAIIDGLQSDGYEFVTVNELLEK